MLEGLLDFNGSDATGRTAFEDMLHTDAFTTNRQILWLTKPLQLAGVVAGLCSAKFVGEVEGRESCTSGPSLAQRSMTASR